MKSKIAIMFVLLVIVLISACTVNRPSEYQEKTQSQSKVEAETPTEISTVQPKTDSRPKTTIQKVEYNITILNEARDNDAEIEIRNEDGQLITTIVVPSKKKFYNLDEGLYVSNPSHKDARIILTNNEQDLLIRENNEGISEIYHFDPKNGGTIVISYYPPGRNENGVIQPSGKLSIRQHKGSLFLL